MTILNNIYRCSSCHLHAIAEEKDFHICINMKDTRIEGETKWVFDGEKWYPLKLHPTKKKQTSDESKHDKSSDGEVPKPYILGAK